MDEVLKYIVLAVTVGLSGICSLMLAVTIVARLKEQKRLRSSIRLVELKNFKLHSMVFAIISAVLCLYLVGQTLDKASPERKFFITNFELSYLEFVIISVSVEVFLLIFCLFFTICSLSKSAVVDRGIYTGYGFIEWNDVYDFMVDEKSGRAVFTVNKESFSTMSGTTPLYRVMQKDVNKLVFILNKNKNRFN